MFTQAMLQDLVAKIGAMTDQLDAARVCVCMCVWVCVCVCVCVCVPNNHVPTWVDVHVNAMVFFKNEDAWATIVLTHAMIMRMYAGRCACKVLFVDENVSY